MTTVTVSYGELEPTHDISLSDGSTTYGLIFAGGSRALQEIPLSPPADAFANEQKNWVGGRGRIKYEDDQSGYFDDFSLWSTTEQKLMPSLQWRFATGIRSGVDSSLPGDNASMAWWKLYGNDPTNKIAPYLAIPFVASSSYSAKTIYLYLRRRGTPGTLTARLRTDSAGSPSSVLKSIQVTTSTITDTINVFQAFVITSAQALTSGTTYWITIEDDGTATSSNYWSVLCNASGTSSKYSTDLSSWTTSTVSMYYRVTDADTSRQWFFFPHEGAFYAVSRNDDGTTSALKTNGVRGTATSGTTTTLTDTNLAMTTNQYAGAYIRIFDGTGDGQIRQIVSNTSTAFTVATWIAPDTTSRYVVYGTDVWTTTTGTPGLSVVRTKPVSIGGIVYFPQGQGASNYIRRMRVNGTSHDFAADGTSNAEVVYCNTEQATPQFYAANLATSRIYAAPATVSWGTNLTYGSPIYVGGSEFRICNMISYNRALHIFKEDGVYSYNNGVVEKLGTSFGDSPDTRTGVGAATQGGYLWFGWAHSIERMIGSSVDDMLNFKRGYNGMPSNRKGICTSIVSALGWMFFVIDGGDSNYSSIMVHNGMGWHEIFRGWATGVRIRNAAWQPCIDSRGRLWFDVGGEMAYIEFPLNASNPLLDSSINYAPEGVIVTSTYDNHDQQLYKIMSNLRVFLEQGSVEVDYQTNSNVGTNTWTVLGTASTTPVTDLPVNLGGVFQIRFRLRLQVTATRTPTVLNGWQLTGRMMQPSKYQFVCTFQVSTDGETKTSETDHDPNALYAQLQTWAVQQTKLTMRSLGYSSDNKTVTVSLPSKSVDSLDEDQWAGRISLAVIQV